LRREFDVIRHRLDPGFRRYVSRNRGPVEINRSGRHGRGSELNPFDSRSGQAFPALLVWPADNPRPSGAWTGHSQEYEHSRVMSVTQPTPPTHKSVC